MDWRVGIGAVADASTCVATEVEAGEVTFSGRCRMSQ
jgi:hypothetical protein